MSVLNKFKSIFKKDNANAASPLSASNSSGSYGGGPHIWAMSPETKAQLARGVKYNLKIAIRGMRRTGKTSLMARLNGRPVEREYTPTPEIAASTIYFAAGGGADTTEGAKVDLWDIVDEGTPSNPPSRKQSGLSPKGAPPPPAAPADASSIDVYRGCQAVIFMVDATRPETLEYVRKHLRDVPPTIAVLIALNFCDSTTQLVTEHDVDDLCRGIPGAATRLVLEAARDAPPPKDFVAPASWMPCSMVTGLGVDAIRAFIDVPFALLQLETLESQMRGLYRGIDHVRADMLQRRAEARFVSRQRDSVPPPAAPVTATASPPRVEPAPAAEPPKLAPASTTQPVPATTSANPPTAGKAPPKSSSGGVNDSFFNDVHESDEDPSDVESEASSSTRTPEPAARPAARSERVESVERSANSGAASPPAVEPVAPAARVPAPQEPGTAASVSAEESGAAEPSVEPTPPKSSASQGPREQVSNDVNIVDTSALEPARIDDGFFGDDSDDAEVEDDVASPAAPEHDADPDDGAVKPTHAVEPTPTPASEPQVDVAALMAQMQSALLAGGAEEGQEADDAGETKKEKKSKKEKKEKKEKKDKKDKKKHSKDPGFAAPEEDDDDLVVVTA